MSRRTDLAEVLPWVSRLHAPRGGKLPRCQGHRWSAMPLKALHGTDEQRAEFDGKYRCKKDAHWRFRALKPRKNQWPPAAESGDYCWMHFVNQLLYNNYECDRIEKWFEKHPEARDGRV